VRVEGVRGFPPPPTTKLAVFYRGGYQNELLLNASGYATSHKWDVQELQVREKLREWQVLDKLDVLDFQRVGVPMENPDSQLASTTYMRIFAQSRDKRVVSMVAAAWNFTFMTHFAGEYAVSGVSGWIKLTTLKACTARWIGALQLRSHS
jgi:hypothetical protein